MQSPKTIFNLNIYRSLFYLVLIAILLALSILSIFYISQSYEALVRWYLNINSCFYRHDVWTTRYFTPAVKHEGNLFALLALAVCISGMIYIIAKRKKYFSITSYPQQKFDGWYWYIAVAGLSIGLWVWGKGLVAASGDELLSYVAAFRLPPVQTLSFFYTTNNHVYFSFINGYASRITGIDAIETGRFISLLANIGLLCCIFSWFSQQFKSKTLAFVALIPVSLQFLVWAYAFQARGFGCHLFCAWVSFLALIQYLQTGNKRALKLYSLFSILGFCFLLTFLYYYACTIIFVFLVQLYRREIDLQYWKYQVITGLGIFLLYLPAFLFSGRTSLLSNEYIESLQLNTHDFLKMFVENTKFFINFIFAFIIRENNPINFILFFSPLLLFITRRKNNKFYGLFFVILWLTWVAICFKMGRTCYNRHMVLLNNLTLVMVIYTLYTTTTIIATKFPKAKTLITAFVFIVPLLAFSIHLYRWDIRHIGYAIEWEDENRLKEVTIKDIRSLPIHSTIACSDERYVFYYYCTKEPYIVTHCPTGNEDYYIACMAEPIPAYLAPNYVFLRRGYDNDIYKHK